MSIWSSGEFVEAGNGELVSASGQSSIVGDFMVSEFDLCKTLCECIGF
jgi:hypothetical protein